MNLEQSTVESNGVARLVNTVIRGGYCVGCGACTAVSGSPMRIEMDSLGQFQAVVDPSNSVAQPAIPLETICPFSGESLNEDQLGRLRFGEDGRYHSHVGYHLSNWAGHVNEASWRERGSSGGMGKWILRELLAEGLVDRVIEVAAHAPDDESDLLYRFRVIDHADDVISGSRSVYYPIEMSGVLQYVRENPGRYAITGIPCFVKAIRLLSRAEPVFQERIRFCVGLICGHLKSARYAEMIGWQMGVPPGSLSYVDFRLKLPGTKANEKGVEVRSIEPDRAVSAPTTVQNLFGTNYNYGFFQYKACDFCDDVVGETADISVGDAWLPEYLGDGRGTNVVVVRHPEIERIVRKGIADGRLAFTEVGVDKVIESQIGGFRQRRAGLAYRLRLTDREGKWRPRKRVNATASHLSPKRRAIYRYRMLLTRRSQEAYEKARAAGDFAIFTREMQPLVDQYEVLKRRSRISQIYRGFQRRWVRLQKLLGLSR
ncbi:MAG TPA: Coenzyme F420 hydrogenase/dehydrogenase, beta subunit C-terminal domain [Rhodothermales bacterium]